MRELRSTGPTFVANTHTVRYHHFQLHRFIVIGNLTWFCAALPHILWHLSNQDKRSEDWTTRAYCFDMIFVVFYNTRHWYLVNTSRVPKLCSSAIHAWTTGFYQSCSWCVYINTSACHCQRLWFRHAEVYYDYTWDVRTVDNGRKWSNTEQYYIYKTGSITVESSVQRKHLLPRRHGRAMTHPL